MSDVLTANKVAATLAQLARDLDAVTEDLNEADSASVMARETYTLAYARAFLAAEGAMDVRRYVATEQTHEQRLGAEAADQIVRALRSRRDTLKVRVDVGRSVGAALKAEQALGGAS